MRRTLGRVWPLIVAAAFTACSKDPLDENVRALEPTTGGSSAPSGSGGASPSTAGPGLDSPSDGASGSAGSAPVAPGSAGGAGQGGEPITFTKRALRQSLADCAVATYGEFASAAVALMQATSELEADPTGGMEAARAAWLTAMASWQRAELFRFGPAARTPQAGARNLRDEIYAFPLANYCRVDQQLVERSYEQADFAGSLSSARGLAAVEYLLFNTSTGNACSSALAINANGDWAAIEGAEFAQRRIAYAARAARDVAERASALLDAWRPEGDDFHGQFVDAGRAGVFASEQQAFNAVSDALLYLEKEVKDWKLGWPLGLVPECLNAPSPCPNDVESRYARVSIDHVRQNLSAFRGIFSGCGAGALGFDDWLEAVGAGDLAERMLDALAQAERTASESGPLEAALLANPESVRALHGAVKGVTDLLKTEFITVLDFELPMALEGDND